MPSLLIMNYNGLFFNRGCFSAVLARAFISMQVGQYYNCKRQIYENLQNIMQRQLSQQQGKQAIKRQGNSVEGCKLERSYSHASKQPRSIDKKMSFNFTVAVRVKPKLYEDQQSAQLNYFAPNNETLVMEYPNKSLTSYSTNKNKKFPFDNIFIDRSNSQIFQSLIKPKLTKILHENLNLTLLTYGITGSGKTHTIFGNEGMREQGLAVLCFNQVLASLNSSAGNIRFMLSYMQIYNEQAQDLLKQDINNTANSQNNQSIKMKSLNVREDGNGKVNIPDLTRVQVNSSQQVIALIEKGNTIRACSSNNVNKLSSRSHAILQLAYFDRRTRIQNTVTVIDLAGSERNVSSSSNLYQVRSKQQDKQNANLMNTLQMEGSNINKSLLTLGNCIKGLEVGEAHIPYRDSKLTRILKDDLSGKAHNIMIACVGRNLSQAEETVNTLQYASRAAKIKVEEIKNQPLSSGFECMHCYKLTPWKNVIETMPNNIPRNDCPQKDKKESKNTTIQFELRFSQQLKAFKKQLIDLIESGTGTQNAKIDGLSEINCSNSGLFPDRTSRSDYLNTGRDNLRAGINDIFAYYETKLSQIVENNPTVNTKDDSDMITHKFNRTKSDYCSQKMDKENINKLNIHNQKIDQLSKTMTLYNIQNNFPYESYRNEAIHTNNSNLRKKFSIKNKQYLNSAHTNNTTLSNGSEFNESFDRNANKINFHSSKVQRMKPDIEFSQGNHCSSQVSSKSAIIRKIEQAKRKQYSTLEQVQYRQQNCSTFEDFEGRFDYKLCENQKQNLSQYRKISYKPGKQSIRIQDEHSQICVSSFMEDNNQFI